MFWFRWSPLSIFLICMQVSEFAFAYSCSRNETLFQLPEAKSEIRLIHQGHARAGRSELRSGEYAGEPLDVVSDETRILNTIEQQLADLETKHPGFQLSFPGVAGLIDWTGLKRNLSGKDAMRDWLRKIEGPNAQQANGIRERITNDTRENAIRRIVVDQLVQNENDPQPLTEQILAERLGLKYDAWRAWRLKNKFDLQGFLQSLKNDLLESGVRSRCELVGREFPVDWAQRLEKLLPMATQTKKAKIWETADDLWKDIREVYIHSFSTGESCELTESWLRERLGILKDAWIKQKKKLEIGPINLKEYLEKQVITPEEIKGFREQNPSLPMLYPDSYASFVALSKLTALGQFDLILLEGIGSANFTLMTAEGVNKYLIANGTSWDALKRRIKLETGYFMTPEQRVGDLKIYLNQDSLWNQMALAYLRSFQKNDPFLSSQPITALFRNAQEYPAEARLSRIRSQIIKLVLESDDENLGNVDNAGLGISLGLKLAGWANWRKLHEFQLESYLRKNPITLQDFAEYVNDYKIKLDRDKLAEKVEKLQRRVAFFDDVRSAMLEIAVKEKEPVITERTLSALVVDFEKRSTIYQFNLRSYLAVNPLSAWEVHKKGNSIDEKGIDELLAHTKKNYDYYDMLEEMNRNALVLLKEGQKLSQTALIGNIDGSTFSSWAIRTGFSLEAFFGEVSGYAAWVQKLIEEVESKEVEPQALEAFERELKDKQAGNRYFSIPDPLLEASDNVFSSDKHLDTYLKRLVLHAEFVGRTLPIPVLEAFDLFLKKQQETLPDGTDQSLEKQRLRNVIPDILFLHRQGPLMKAKARYKKALEKELKNIEPGLDWGKQIKNLQAAFDRLKSPSITVPISKIKPPVRILPNVKNESLESYLQFILLRVAFLEEEISADALENLNRFLESEKILLPRQEKGYQVTPVVKFLLKIIPHLPSDLQETIKKSILLKNFQFAFSGNFEQQVKKTRNPARAASSKPRTVGLSIPEGFKKLNWSKERPEWGMGKVTMAKEENEGWTIRINDVPVVAGGVQQGKAFIQIAGFERKVLVTEDDLFRSLNLEVGALYLEAQKETNEVKLRWTLSALPGKLEDRNKYPSEAKKLKDKLQALPFISVKVTEPKHLEEAIEQTLNNLFQMLEIYFKEKAERKLVPAMSFEEWGELPGEFWISESDLLQMTDSQFDGDVVVFLGLSGISFHIYSHKEENNSLPRMQRIYQLQEELGSERIEFFEENFDNIPHRSRAPIFHLSMNQPPKNFFDVKNSLGEPLYFYRYVGDEAGLTFGALAEREPTPGVARTLFEMRSEIRALAQDFIANLVVSRAA